MNKKSLDVLKRYTTKKSDNTCNNVIFNGFWCNGFMIVVTSEKNKIIINESKDYKLPNIEKIKEFNFSTVKSKKISKDTLKKLFEFSKEIQNFQIKFSKEKITLVNEFIFLEGKNDILESELSFDGKNFRNFLEFCVNEYVFDLSVDELKIEKNGEEFARALKIKQDSNNYIILLDAIFPERAKEFILEEDEIKLSEEKRFL